MAPVVADYPFGDDDVYLYIGADCDGCSADWLELEVSSSADTCADCAGVPGGTAYEDMCGVCDDDPANDCEMDCFGVWGGSGVLDACDECRDALDVTDNVTDDFDFWDGDLWNTLPDRYTYSGGSLRVYWDASSAPEHMRTRETGARASQATSTATKRVTTTLSCSTDPRQGWDISGNLAVAYNCGTLYIIRAESSAFEACDTRAPKLRCLTRCRQRHVHGFHGGGVTLDEDCRAVITTSTSAPTMTKAL